MTDVEDTVPPLGAGADGAAPGDVTVEYAGEYVTIPTGTRFTIGREGDLALDDNRFLHRHFLQIEEAGVSGGSSTSGRAWRRR